MQEIVNHFGYDIIFGKTSNVKTIMPPYRRFIPFNHYVFHLHYFLFSIKAPPSDYGHGKRLILYLCLAFVWFVSTMWPFKKNLLLYSREVCHLC